MNLSGGVQVEGLTFTGSYATTIDAVLVSGAAIEAYGTNPIAVTANQSPFAAATIATPFSGTSGVALTVASTATSGSPTVTLDASVGSVTFASLSVAAGTLQIDNSVTTSSATATAGALDVEGMLNVSSSMTVSGNALLQGVSSGADIALAGNAALTYQSSAASSFAGTIAGPYAEIETQADPVSGDSTNSLTLTGPVTIAGIQDAAGKLALNGSTTITNGDGSGTGLLVTNDAIITGSGPLALDDQTGQTAPTPFVYDSTAARDGSGAVESVYSGAISGPGELELTSIGILQITSSLKTYHGGTDIQGDLSQSSTSGIIQLAHDPATGLPATLGTGGLAIGNWGELDLNGCSLTVPALNNDASINQDPNLPDYLFSNALITDTNTSTAAATVFTLDTPATTSSEYCGSFADSNIRIVKTGGGTFMPEGPMCLIQTAAGLEIDDGMVELGPEFNSTDSGNNLALTMNGGTLDLEGGQIEQQSPPQLHLSQLDGTAAATITDYSSTLAGSGSQYYSTEIVMQLVAQSHPSIFAGVIQQQTPSAANDIAGQPIDSFWTAWTKAVRAHWS